MRAPQTHSRLDTDSDFSTPPGYEPLNLEQYDEPIKGRNRKPVLGFLLFVIAAIAALLCGCERGPTEEDMAGCASPRNPTWADLARCERARHEETVK